MNLKEAIDRIESTLPGCPKKDCFACKANEEAVNAIKQAREVLLASLPTLRAAYKNSSRFMAFSTTPKRFVTDKEEVVDYLVYDEAQKLTNE